MWVFDDDASAITGQELAQRAWEEVAAVDFILLARTRAWVDTKARFVIAVALHAGVARPFLQYGHEEILQTRRVGLLTLVTILSLIHI